MVNVPPVLRPVQEYSCYRLLLRDYYLSRKHKRAGFSYRAFAARCGIKSPNYLQLVIQGRRNLSDSLATQVARAMDVTERERRYFLALIRKSNAGTVEEKREAETQLAVATKKIISHQIPSAQTEVLRHWWHLVIREMVLLRDFNSDGKWISDRLGGLITPEQAESSLELLIQSGFLIRARKGLVQANPVVETSEQIELSWIVDAHLQTFKVWSKLLPALNPNERDLGLLNIPISAQKIPELKRRIVAFHDEIIGWVQDEKNADQVVQLGTYLVPLTAQLE